MSEGIANIVGDTVMDYLTTRWTRSKLAAFPVPVPPDPGHGVDQVCPIVYFGQPFDAGDPSSLEALSDYTAAQLKGLQVGNDYLNGVGYLTINVAEIDSKQLDRGSRGSFIGRDRVLLIMALPTVNGAKIAADYAAALAPLFHGVDLRPAAGIQRIWNDTDQEAVSQIPNDIGLYKNWLWFQMSLVLRRLYRQNRAGIQPIIAA